MGYRGSNNTDSWWRPALSNNNYDDFGDAYIDDETYQNLAKQWAIDMYVEIERRFVL